MNAGIYHMEENKNREGKRGGYERVEVNSNGID